MLSFFSKPYLTIIGKILKFILFRLLENAFLSQNIESIHFYSCSPPPPAKLSTRFLSYNSPRQNFLKIVRGEGGGNYERCEEVTKIKLLRYWSQVLINPTIFLPFTFLVTVLLYHSLDSSMLKF